MPKLKIGDQFTTIPFEPDLVAELLFNGFTVVPDQGANLDFEGQQIKESLKKLWQDFPGGRTVPGRSTLKGPEVTPDTGIERQPGQGYSKPGLDWQSDYRTFDPNPTTIYKNRAIDPFSAPNGQMVQAPQEGQGGGGLFANVIDTLKTLNSLKNLGSA